MVEGKGLNGPSMDAGAGSASAGEGPSGAAVSQGGAAAGAGGLAGSSKAVLAIVVAVAIVAASAMSYLYLMKDDDDDGGDDGPDGGGDDGGEVGANHAVRVTGRDGALKNYTLDDLIKLQATKRNGSAENRFGNWIGTGQYVGADVSLILDDVGGMVPGDLLLVEATDGYNQTYTYYNAYPDRDWLGIQGPMVLSYSFNGTKAPDWQDGPMITLLPEDGEYSNQDCNWTSAVGQGYNVNPSAGGRWVKNVANITVIPGTRDWALNLTGVSEKVFSKTEFEMFANWFPAQYTDGEGNLWSGVPLWRLVSLVDAGPARGVGAFNASYKPEPGSGYDVMMQGKDGWTQYLPNGTLANGDDTVIVANELGGEPLSEDDAPLKAIAPDHPKKLWVKWLTNVSLVPAWDLCLVGEENSTIYYDALIQMANETGLAYRYKVNYPKLPIEGPWEYTGIPLAALVAEVWNTSVDYSVEVRAYDGYGVDLTREEVEGGVQLYDMDKNETGGTATVMLAFIEDGGGWFDGGPLRLVVVNETGAVTDAALSNRMVNELVVTERIPDWEVQIEMSMTTQPHNLTAFEREYYEHSAQPGCHLANVTCMGSNWTGIPLWILVSAVDGNDTATHWDFNDTLATEGYNVTIWGSADEVTGFYCNVTVHSSWVARNDSIVVANKADGSRLDGSEWPLRLVGGGWSDVMNVKSVWKIEVVD